MLRSHSVVIILFLSACCTRSLAQVGDHPVDVKGPRSAAADSTYDMAVVEHIPEFKGGPSAMYPYLSKHLKYPQDAYDAGIMGKVYVEFTIDTDGRVIDVRLRRSVYPSLDQEAIRAIASMPPWTPGMMDGHPVKCRLILPLNFTMPAKDAKGKGK